MAVGLMIAGYRTDMWPPGPVPSVTLAGLRLEIQEQCPHYPSPCPTPPTGWHFILGPLALTRVSGVALGTRTGQGNSEV
jgi:hypothetical protein